jgi:hypothetical protein
MSSATARSSARAASSSALALTYVELTALS